MNQSFSPFPSEDLPMLPDSRKTSRLPPLQFAETGDLPLQTPLVSHPVMPSIPELMNGSAPLVPAKKSHWNSGLPGIPVLQQPLFTPFAIAAHAEDFATATPIDSLLVIHEPASATPSVPRAIQPSLENEQASLDSSKNELLDVLRPLVEDSVQRLLLEPGIGRGTYLEPLLRSTIRRALAEHSPKQSPFREPGFLDRVSWRLAALFRSRTYEEIYFEKTRRFRGEEVYLLEKIKLSMISYASSDPARHASAKRVHSTARRIADGAINKEGAIQFFYDLPEGRHAIVREGKNAMLIAVVVGTPNEALHIDLDYMLQRIEERFGSQFHNLEDTLLLCIQPLLEDCLLIVAPGSNH